MRDLLWQQPWAVWGFAAAMPLVMLYLLRGRRRRLRVSSVLPFLSVSSQVARRRQLLLDPLLLCQLLILVGLVVAALGPHRWRDAGGSSTIMVLDTSASMAASTGGVDRWQALQGEVRRQMAGLHERDEVALVTSGRTATIAMSWTSDRSALRGAVAALRAVAATEDWNGAWSLVKVLRAARPKAKLVVITDHPGRFSLDGEGTLVRVGAVGSNASVVALRVSRFLMGPPDADVFVEAITYSQQPVEATVELWQRDRLLQRERVRLEPGQLWTWHVHGDLPAGPLTARILADGDGLAVDNEVWSWLPDPRQVIMASADTGEALPFWVSRLEHASQGALRIADRDGDAQPTSVVHVRQGAPLLEWTQPTLTIWPGTGSEAALAHVVPDHPAMRHLKQITGWTVQGVQQHPLPSEARPLAWAVNERGEWPIVWEADSHGARQLILGFQPAAQGYLPLEELVLLLNSVQWVVGFDSLGPQLLSLGVMLPAVEDGRETMDWVQQPGVFGQGANASEPRWAAAGLGSSEADLWRTEPLVVPATRPRRSTTWNPQVLRSLHASWLWGALALLVFEALWAWRRLKT